MIRSDAQSQEEDELLDEEELLSSQGPSASSLQIDELSCKTAQNLEASSINLSYGPSAKQTKEIADGKAVGLDTYGAKVSSNDSWEAGRVGSMAARLLHDVHVSLT